MSGQTTKPYKNTLSGSIGAGMGSLLTPGGRKYYILEHKVSSKYHRAGESQEIIVDNIEMGRDTHCQVRFDESFKTVSRHHAAIVKAGDQWKLVQISKTNSTLLNGQPVRTEWYLQNGDEIQLSVNGPKLGFIVPTGKNSTVGSIGLTRRLSLFRQQALRPYKTAIASLAACLVLAVGGLGTWNVIRDNKFNQELADAHEKLAEAARTIANLEELVAKAAIKQKEMDSLLAIKSRPIIKTVIVRQEDDTKKLQPYEEDIFYMTALVYAEYNGQTIVFKTEEGGCLGWTGTGYLLNDGRFVTAKHCVEGWKFNSIEVIAQQLASLKNETLQSLFVYGLTNTNGVTLRSAIIARSPSKELRFSSSDFRFNRSDEKAVALNDDLFITRASGDGGTDWAYARVNQNGSIIGDAALSANLPAGARLEVLGFPQGMSTESSSCLYGSCQTAGRGLNDGLILITGKNYEHGNSGGPVFYNDNGTFKAVGIVSFSIFDNMGGLTPLYNLR